MTVQRAVKNVLYHDRCAICELLGRQPSSNDFNGRKDRELKRGQSQFKKIDPLIKARWISSARERKEGAFAGNKQLKQQYPGLFQNSGSDGTAMRK